MLSRQAIGQGWLITVKETYNSYDMGQLAALQNQVAAGSVVPAKVLQAFPNFFGTQVTLYINFKSSARLGFFWEYTSTGGRIHYKDYSGVLRIDQILSRNAYGIKYEERPLNFNEVFSLVGGIGVSGLFTRMRTEDYIEVPYNKYLQETKMKALGIGLEPDVSLQCIKSRLVGRLGIGYQVSFSKPFHLVDNKNLVLIYNNEEVGPQWDGFRIGVSLGYVLSSRQEKL